MLRCLDGPPTVTNATSTRRWTYADYCRIPADRRRHEIVDARHFVTPAPSPRHQEVALRLAAQFLRAVESAGRGRVFVAPLDVHLAPGTIVQPDLVVLSKRRTSIVGPKKLTGVPDLLVEILSPSHRTHDTVRKRERYQRAGVRELWLVDPDACTVTQLVLRKGRYSLVATATDTIAARALRGVRLDLTEVFA